MDDYDAEKMPPIEIDPEDHPLQHEYWLWYSRKGAHRATDYSKSLRMVGRCATIEHWLALYCQLRRPTALNPFRELSLFKKGIRPMWEDPANSKGGQWLIRLRKNQIDRAWEDICMAMLGEQFMVDDEICGVVLTTKIPVSPFYANFIVELNNMMTKGKPLADDNNGMRNGKIVEVCAYMYA